MDKQSVQVTLNNKNVPTRFERSGLVYRIKEVQECWRLMGAWWDGEGEQTFFRVLTDKGGIYELRFDHGTSKWVIAGVKD